MVDIPEVTAEDLKSKPLSSFLGGGQSSAQPTQTAAPSSLAGVKLSDIMGKDIGSPQSAETTAPKEIPAAEKEREAKINAYSEKEGKRVKEEGAEGAFMSGLGNVPLVGPAFQAGKRYVQAYQGEGQGSTIGERVEDLRNQREAYEREVNKQHPYAKLGGELAQIAPMMFIPGVGWAGAAARTGTTAAIGAARAAEIAKTAGTLESLTAAGASAAEIAKAAKAAEAAQEIGTLAKAAPGLAEVAGMGAEGGAWGAASAAGNKYFGTAQPSDQADIGEATKEGAMFGAGIGAGGKTIAAAYNKMAPEWWQNLRMTPNFIREALGKDDPILTTFMEKQKVGDPEGLWFKKMQEAKASGADVNPLDYRTKETDAWLQEQFQNHPDALIKLKQELNDRLSGASERGRSFFKKMAGVAEDGEFNIDKVRTEAQSFADRINHENFAEANHPANAAGTWSPNWDKALQDPSVEGALFSFDKKFSARKGEDFKSPFGRRGDMDISESNLDPNIAAHLKENGVETLGDLAKLKPADVNAIYGYDPNIPSDTGKAFNTKQIYDELKAGIKGMNLNERVILNPESINAEYLDNLQLYLRNVAKGTEGKTSLPIDRAAGKKIESWADDIVNTLRNENDIYAKAHDTRAQFHRESNALDAGSSFMNSLGDTNKTSKFANEAKNMTPEEKEFFKYGVIDWIHNKGITGGGPTRGAPIDAQLAYRKIQTWLTKPDVEKTLSEVLGKNEFQSLGTFLKGEVLANDSASRAQELGAKGNLLSHFLRNAYIPGAGGIDWLLGHPAFSIPAVAYRITDFYMGERYARQIANKFTNPNPADFQSAYDEVFKKPEIRDGINRFMAGVAYGISVQAGESKFNANRVNDATSKMSDAARKFTEDGIKEGMKIANERLQGGSPPQERADGGRVGYAGGGKTGYDWRQHYAPKDDTVGPVAPARASGYYPKEWREENRQKGFAGRARQLRNRAESEDTPVDEMMESRTKRDDGGRTLTQPVMPLALDDPMRQQNFNAYKQDAKTLNETGDPLTVYRGERRAHPAGEMPTTKGRAVPSFATDKYVADVYAGKPLNFHGDTVNQSNVGKYHFAANNPIDLRHLGGHADLDDVFKSLPIDLSKPTALKEGKLGYNDVAKILSTLDQTVENSNAQSDTGYSHKDFKSVAREVRAHGKTPWANEEILKLLGNTRVDLYALGDNPEFVNALRRMKHDALIHKDVFDGGAGRYQGDKANLGKDKSGTVLIDAYRPLDPGVYKSSWGNKGTFSRKSKNPLESRGGPIKRSTGGRIPEADKLFKDAKKYIDSRTKGLLNEPDEKIVHALKIAKARNS